MERWHRNSLQASDSVDIFETVLKNALDEVVDEDMGDQQEGDKTVLKTCVTQQSYSTAENDLVRRCGWASEWLATSALSEENIFLKSLTLCKPSMIGITAMNGYQILQYQKKAPKPSTESDPTHFFNDKISTDLIAAQTDIPDGLININAG